jgi:hypothetical protein
LANDCRLYGPQLETTLVELPKLKLPADLATGVAASAIFKNWLEYLSEGVKLTADMA